MKASGRSRDKRKKVLIVDVSLQDGSGLDLVKDLHARQPKLPLLVLGALRKILLGQTALSEAIVSRLVNRRMRGEPTGLRSPVELLSDRELEIYRSLGEGHGTREIAARLRIAVSTVESYRAGIKQKLDLKNTTELIAHAARFVAAESGV